MAAGREREAGRLAAGAGDAAARRPPHGEVVLTMPKRASRRQALDWAAGHRAWVEAQLRRDRPRLRPGAGAELPLYGAPHASTGTRAAAGARIEAGIGGGRRAAGESRGAASLRWLRRHAPRSCRAETPNSPRNAGVGVSRSAVGDPRVALGELLLVGRDPLQLAADPGAGLSSAARPSPTKWRIASK